MSAIRTVLALLLCVAVAPAAELRTLTGATVVGDLVSIDGKEIVLKTPEGPVSTPLAQVLLLDMQAPAVPPREGAYTDVELIDGSLLHCAEFRLKERDVELKLLTGQDAKVPLASVRYVLNDAQDEKNRKEWQEKFLSQQKNTDLLGIKSADGRVNSLKGTFGAGDAEGKTIAFDLNTAGRSLPVRLDRVHGLAFLRTNISGLPEAVCKLYDTQQTLLMVRTVTATADGVRLETPAGVQLEYPRAMIARLDFSKGKLSLLSAMDPARVVETSTEERVEHFRRNQNLDGGKIRLRVKDEKAPTGFSLQPFDTGLSMHATTELEYDLKGEYNEFKATAGIDESVGGTDGPVVLKIEGDGRELLSLTLTRRDPASPVLLNIKNVNRLRIIVTSGELLDLGKHLTLADARVSK